MSDVDCVQCGFAELGQVWCTCYAARCGKKIEEEEQFGTRFLTWGEGKDSIDRY